MGKNYDMTRGKKAAGELAGEEKFFELNPLSLRHYERKELSLYTALALAHR